MNKIIGIESGLQYTNKGYRTEKTYLGENQRPLFVDYGTWYRLRYNYYYIDIPLKVRFAAGQKKVRFSASAGITTGFLVGIKHIIQKEKGNSYRESIPTDGYNRVNLSPTISVGIDCRVTPRSTIRIEPTFRYGLLPLRKTAEGSFKEHLWDVGLNISYLIGVK